MFSGDYSRGISPVTRSFKQQLIDSGLLQQLPALFAAAAAAQHLDAAPAVVADDGSSSGSSNSKGWGILNDPLALERDVVVLGYGFESLRDRFPSAQQPVQAEFDKLIGAACILPGARLCVAVLQHLSRRLGPMQVPLQRVAERCTQSNLCMACKSAAMLFPSIAVTAHESLSSTSAQHKGLSAQLVYSTNCAQMLAVALVFMALTPMIERAAPSGGLDRLPDGSSNARSVWQLVLRLESKVPAWCADMAELLGCSSRAVLWVASFEPHVEARERLKVTEYAYEAAVVATTPDTAQQVTDTMPRAEYAQRGEHALLQLLQEQHKLHAQVLLLFLHTAAKQPTSAPDYPSWVFAGVKGSGKALFHVRALSTVLTLIQGAEKAMSDAYGLERPAQHLLQEAELPAAVEREFQQLPRELLSKVPRLRRSKLGSTNTSSWS